MRHFLVCATFSLLIPQIPVARATPDFSGTWVWDTARSEHHPAAEMLVIVQTATGLTLHQVMCCRQAGEEWTWTVPFNKWGLRAVRPGDDKPIQARWDGDALLIHAGPEIDTRGGSLRIWRLAADGRELMEDLINRGFGLRFDFKEASVSKMYTRDRHVYIKR